jgi:hypothetical protein
MSDEKARDRENNNAPEGKKPYVKPEVKEVPLRPEEAVLGACKSNGQAGPAQATCAVPAPCATLGS